MMCTSTNVCHSVNESLFTALIYKINTAPMKCATLFFVFVFDIFFLQNVNNFILLLSIDMCKKPLKLFPFTHFHHFLPKLILFPNPFSTTLPFIFHSSILRPDFSQYYLCQKNLTPASLVCRYYYCLLHTFTSQLIILPGIIIYV